MVTETIEPVQPDEQSVGFTETQTVTLFEPPDSLQLASGQQLGPVQVAYETYGRLSPERDNAIFICHALTGDAHAAGWRTPESRKPGWWDALIGPGKGLDTDRYHVICANVLGGCLGTIGPSSINPQTGEPYGPDFPFVTVADIVQVHQRLTESLGIDRLLAVIGGSLGGMQVLDWAVRFPQTVKSAIVLAAGAKLMAQGIAFNAVGRRAIFTDPAFHDGSYYEHNDKPRFGLALARMIAHITYLSERSIEAKFGRRLQHSEELTYDLQKETEFQIESYLHYQGQQFVERFDANSYLTLTRAMDYFDLAGGHESLTAALLSTNARFLIASYTTDWLFPTIQSRELTRALIEAGKHVSAVEFDSPFGHDAFLIDREIPELERLIAPFLEQARRV